MDFLPSVFYRELKKNCSILPQSPTAISKEYVPSVFYWELQKNYSPCHNHWRVYRRNHQRMVHIPMRATVRLPGRSAQLPTDAANPIRPCSNTFLPTDVPKDFEKSGEIFKILVQNSKKYRRSLMPPPKKILFYSPSVKL
jgi:hypothetical protein